MSDFDTEFWPESDNSDCPVGLARVVSDILLKDKEVFRTWC
jgi:hypothetical protein